MGELLTPEEGIEIVKFARRNIEYHSATGAPSREKPGQDIFMEDRGVFVTLHTFPGKELRGCIGFPYAVKPLWQAVTEASIESAFRDPRFPPVQAGELEKIIVEVSVLTQPKEVTGGKKELPEKIEIGKDGLIVQRDERSGLLLPQVASAEGWSAEEFLRNTCKKAFLPEAAWTSAAVKILKFQAQIFCETEPNGSVQEKKD